MSRIAIVFAFLLLAPACSLADFVSDKYQEQRRDAAREQAEKEAEARRADAAVQDDRRAKLIAVQEAKLEEGKYAEFAAACASGSPEGSVFTGHAEPNPELVRYGLQQKDGTYTVIVSDCAQVPTRAKEAHAALVAAQAALDAAGGLPKPKGSY